MSTNNNSNNLFGMLGSTASPTTSFASTAQAPPQQRSLLQPANTNQSTGLSQAQSVNIIMGNGAM